MNWTELCSLYQLNDTDRKILACIRADGSAAYVIPDFFAGKSIILFEHVLAGLWRRMNKA